MTTLTQARHAAIQLCLMPLPLSARAHLSIISDFLDKQVPLNIENDKLKQRVARAEGFVKEVRDRTALMVETTDAARDKWDAEVLASGAPTQAPPRVRRTFDDPTAVVPPLPILCMSSNPYNEGMGVPCQCPNCVTVRPHA